MIKRLITLMAVMLTLVSIAACSPETKETTANPNSNKVLFVGGEVGDPYIIQRLKKMGMEVTAKTGKEVTAEDTKNVGLIYISYTAKPSDLETKTLGTTAPIITSNAKMAALHGLIKNQDQAGQFVHEHGIKTIEIVDEKHPIASGYTGKMDVYTKISNTVYATPGEQAAVIATAPDDKSKGMIFAYDKGTKDANGNAAPARLVYYYVFHDSEGKISDDGWKLFDSTVKWATGMQ